MDRNAFGPLHGWNAQEQEWLLQLAMQPEFTELWTIHEEAGHLATPRSLVRRKDMADAWRGISADLDALLDDLGRCTDDAGMPLAWGDVALHCLVEAARASVLGPLMGLTPSLCDLLVQAAIAHDAGKLEEILAVRSARFLSPPGSEWDAYEKAGLHTQERLRNVGCSEHMIGIASAAGHGSLNRVHRLLSLPDLEADDLAYLALHYIDDYTINSLPVTPAEKRADGTWMNDVDRRMEKNVRSPHYAGIDREAMAHFNGVSMHTFQRMTALRVQERLAQMLQIEPALLPEYIEKRLREQVNR